MASRHAKYLTITTFDGKKKKLKFYGGSEKEAAAKRDIAAARMQIGKLSVAERVTVESWANEWYETYVEPQASECEARQTRGILDKHIIPAIGDICLQDLRLHHLQKFANGLKSCSYSLIRKIKSAVVGITKTARRNMLIVEDPADAIVWPYGKKGERRALTEAEEAAFLSVVQKHHKGALFAVMYYCGLRPGEVRALTWHNVDLEEGWISVTSAVKKDGGCIGDPKSKAGKRRVPIPAEMAELLQKMPKTSLYVFPSGKDGVMTEQGFNRSWSSFKRDMYIEMGVTTYRNQLCKEETERLSLYEVTPYYLRHTYATKLVASMVDPKTVQYLLGHSTAIITLDVYAHADNRAINSSKAAVENCFKSISRIS